MRQSRKAVQNINETRSGLLDKINNTDTLLAMLTKKERVLKSLKLDVDMGHYYQFYRSKRDHNRVL